MQEIEEKVRIIQQRLKDASDRQKSYADLKRKDIEYEVGDKLFLKVSHGGRYSGLERKEN